LKSKEENNQSDIILIKKKIEDELLVPSSNPEVTS